MNISMLSTVLLCLKQLHLVLRNSPHLRSILELCTIDTVSGSRLQKYRRKANVLFGGRGEHHVQLWQIWRIFHFGRDTERKDLALTCMRKWPKASWHFFAFWPRKRMVTQKMTWVVTDTSARMQSTFFTSELDFLERDQCISCQCSLSCKRNGCTSKGTSTRGTKSLEFVYMYSDQTGWSRLRTRIFERLSTTHIVFTHPRIRIDGCSA